MRESLILRPATAGDVQAVTRLLYMPLGRMADYLFGAGRADRAESVLADLFIRPANRFSYQFTDVALLPTGIVAAMVSYPAAMMRRLRLPTAWHLMVVCGPMGLLRFLWRSVPLMGIREAEAGQYFIDSVAVLPTAQGQGIGSRLLLYAEEKAAALGLAACALTVEVANPRARRLYERLGYRVVETFESARLARRIGYAGLHRMVKPL